MAEWRLGSYELLRRLGEGGMAQVYLARDVRLGREVAVKVLDRKLAERPGFRERFMREARVAAALDHPNIVPLFDFGDAEALYLVMPYVSGGSLQDLLPRAPLPIGEVVTFGSQIADALEYAHLRKVVHRDVKPANMLLHADGRLMLSDFGLAKIVNATHKLAAPRNRPDAGTPEYMAPEQVVGSSDARSDIYGLGVVLYLLLAGRLPFSGSSSHEVMQAHLYKEPTPLRRYNPTVPVAMEAVIMRAMAKQPGERFQRANELGAALLSALIADHGSAPTFVISSPSHGSSRPTGQHPIAMPPPQIPDPAGEAPPWRQRVASQPVASQPVASSQGAGASAIPPTPATSSWDGSHASAASSLTGILPNLNMPFTSLDSSQGAPSATDLMSGGGLGGFGARSAQSGFSGTNNASSFAGASGIGGVSSFDSQVAGASPGIPNARSMGRMPAMRTSYPPAYPPPVFPPAAPPEYPPVMNSGAHPAYTGAQTRQIHPMAQQMAQTPFEARPPAPVAPVAHGAPTYGPSSARSVGPHAQQAEVRATLPGSRMTEPPPTVEARERRSLFWVVIALLLIMLVIAVIVLLRWLEAGTATGAASGFVSLLLG